MKVNLLLNRLVYNKKYLILIFVFIIFIIINILYRPYLLEKQSFSRAVFDRNGKLLKLTLTNEDKYKVFTKLNNIPENFKKSVLLYEDKYFYYHLGVNPFSLIRASFSLFKNRKIGASTVTMQVVRIKDNLNTKTILGKVEQILKAIQLEIFYSKDEILEAYFNLVPYGHNIEGVEAASLIYFNTDVKNLSISEIFALTVIPQNPSNRTPTNDIGFKNMIEAREKLAKIWFKQENYKLLPIQINLNLPSEAMHLVQDMLITSDKNIINTTIDLNIQKQMEKQVRNYIKKKEVYGIYNASILLIDSANMNVIASIGSKDFFDNNIQGQNNGVKALRSPGSAMKPFIYGLALDQGLIHSKTMLKDIPKSFGIYNPENYDRQYMGTVSADLALAYSRNVPAVDLLKQLKPSSFYNLLVKSGLNLKYENYYGLALALGGYEISMEEVGKLYCALLNRGILKNLKKDLYDKDNYRTEILSPESSFIVLKMLEKNEPINSYSKYIILKDETIPISWKTGTSFGYKDAWSVGTVGKYVLVVWIGNFDGTGNNNFKGREAAGPLFFNIAEFLEKTYPDIKKYRYNTVGLNVKDVEVCATTGDIKTNLCPKSDTALFIPTVSPIKSSNVYRKIPIDIETNKRSCFNNPPFTKEEIFEFWPSDIEKAKNSVGIFIKKPPEFKETCNLNIRTTNEKNPEIISPINNLIYYKQNNKKISLKSSVASGVKKTFWFSNQKFLGESVANEILFIELKIGKQVITVVDDNGNSSSINIEIMNFKK